MATAAAAAAELERDFELAKAAMMTDDTKRSAIVQHSLSESALYDAEALSLILGAVQRRIKELHGQHVTDPAKLDAMRRTIFEPRSVHRMCRYEQCRMVSFNAGDSFYSHRYKCALKATGEIYVCPLSGLSHRCGDGLACPHLVYTDGKESACCEISGRLFEAGIGSLDTRERVFGLNGNIEGGGGGDDNAVASLDYGESEAPADDGPDSSLPTIMSSSSQHSATAAGDTSFGDESSHHPRHRRRLNNATTVSSEQRVLALIDASEQRYDALQQAFGANSNSDSSEEDGDGDDDVTADINRLLRRQSRRQQRQQRQRIEDAGMASTSASVSLSRTKRLPPATTTTTRTKRAAASSVPDSDSAVFAHLMRAIDMLVYGNTTRDALINRVLEFRRLFHSKMLGRYALTNAVLDVQGAAATAEVSNAWLLSKTLRYYRDAMGSHEMHEQVARRLGYVANTVALSEGQLRAVLEHQWMSHLPNASRRAPILEYFARAVMTACRLLTAMPDYKKASCQIKKVAIAVLCYMRDGVCYDVLYDENTRLLVPGFRTTSSIKRRVCARLKTCGFGMRDSPYSMVVNNNSENDEQAEAGTATAATDDPYYQHLDDDNDNDEGELPPTTRCREVWLLPMHTFLQNLPANEVVGQTELPGKLVSKMIHARREVRGVHSSIFDASRNAALDTMTIDELEERFCLHRHFAIRRTMGLILADAT